MALAKRLLALTTAALALLTAAAPAAAIMNGAPDGTTHRNVGLVGALLPGNVVVPVCSGFLVSPRVVLTAGHCTKAIGDLGATRAVVSFSPNLLITLSPAFAGTPVTDPGYTGEGFDRRDFGAVVFGGNITSIQPARLPGANALGQARAELRELPFTAVGYGAITRLLENEPPDDPGSAGEGGEERDHSPWVFLSNLQRHRAVSGFSALNPDVVRLSQNVALGDGGTCHGDSGGPYFTTLGGQYTAVAMTISGDPICQATGVGLRLDTPAARSFLSSVGVTPP